MTEPRSGELRVLAPDGAPEIETGADLAALVGSLVAPVDGDIVVVTSKAVAKAEGRVTTRSRDEMVAEETVRVVARRGSLVVARTRLGVTQAAAGVDQSNVASGHVVPLPLDPDGSARAIREALRVSTGANVGVVVTDTAGRAWRTGQTDIAVGAAGVRVLESFVGVHDGHGHELRVTEPAVADELAGAAELAQGKLGGRPFAVVRGRADLVLPPDDHGPGAVALVRPDPEDLFGLGAREAVVQALLGDPADLPAYGAAAERDDLVTALRTVLGDDAVVSEEPVLLARGPERVVAALAFAHGWTASTQSAEVSVLRPPGP
ncbi:coenzyme F420-0:L-glutamate ligase [Nocardioides sp.]|uniref:coenzyme F420-0:L-glutamate ligase n=1 Tax=Nocardioides sp. TaxID=35761 RepID=UPI003528D2A3